MFSSLSFGEWEYFFENPKGDRVYWDKDKVRVSGGFVYWYNMLDLIKPIPGISLQGVLSISSYNESNCQKMSSTTLSTTGFERAMGEGESETQNHIENPPMAYIEPGVPGYDLLVLVCDYANNL